MKKFALAAAALALLVFAASSCKKDKQPKENTTPVIAWENNSNFAACEITDKMDASVSLTAKEGIQEMVISFTKLPLTLVGVVNQHIDGRSFPQNLASSSNNYLATLDLVNDSSVSEYIKGLNMIVPSTIKGSTACTINFKSLIINLMNNQILENDANISFTLSVVDKADQKASKNLTFHYTTGPYITVKNYAFAASVPGKIEKASITVNSGSQTLINKLKGSVFDGVPVNNGVMLDLIDNSTAAGKLASYGLTTGAKLKGQTKAALDLDEFIKLAVKDDIATDKSYGTHVFTLTIEDANGKTSSESLEYVYQQQ